MGIDEKDVQFQDVFKKAKQNISADSIQKEIKIHRPDAILNGDWWKIKCLFHDDHNPSLCIHAKDGHFICHGCGEKGDWLIFIAKSQKITRLEAANLLAYNCDEKVSGNHEIQKVERPEPCIPIPNDIIENVVSYFKSEYGSSRYGEFNNLWIYRDRNEDAVFITVRFEDSSRKKIIPFYYSVKLEWHPGQPFSQNLPLYNLPGIIQNPDSTILVVEGEKCCEAILPELSSSNIVPCTWSFGAKGVKKSDWEPLRGRSVILWPDADVVGAEAALDIVDVLLKISCKIQIVPYPEGVPSGWDCADAVSEKRDINALINDAIPWEEFKEMKSNKKNATGKKNKKKDKDSDSITEKALRLILKEIKLYNDGETGYAVFNVNDHCETAWVRSKQFSKFIRWLYRHSEGRGLSEYYVNEIENELESIAIYEGQLANIYGRVGKTCDNNIIINPGWKDWKYIDVSAPGWAIKASVTSVSTVTQDSLSPHSLFIRPRGMLPLPYPEKGKGSINDLRRFIGAVGDDNRFLLIISFIIQSFFYDGPFPILVILAEPGSGKTFATNIIKNIFDPHEAMTMSIPRESRDVFAAAGVSWLMAYDNFSSVPQWLSDIFCRFSTGGAVIDREMYSNGDAYIYSAKRPAIVNGITDFFSQSDVIQRSIIINFRRIDPEDRRDEHELWSDFYGVAPGIFYDLLDILVKVLQLLPKIKVTKPSRMIDFCKLGTATGLALGYEEDAFMIAYEENQRSANDITLEASQIFPILKMVLEQDSSFEGTPQELLTKLNSTNYDVTRSKYWPKTPAILSGHLKRLAPNLRAAGYNVEIWRDHNGRKISISRTIHKDKENSVTSVTADTVETQITEESKDVADIVKSHDIELNIRSSSNDEIVINNNLQRGWYNEI